MTDYSDRPYRYFVTYLADDLPRRRFVDLRYPIGEDRNLTFLEDLIAKLEQPRGGELPTVVLLDFQRIERRAPGEGRVQLSGLRKPDRATLYELLKANGAPLQLVQRFHAEADQPNLTADELRVVLMAMLEAPGQVGPAESPQAMTVGELESLAPEAPQAARATSEALEALVTSWKADRLKAVQRCGEQLAAVLAPEPESVGA